MTIKVYALRVRGEEEVRYIGQTNNVERRLDAHIKAIRWQWRPDDFAIWAAFYSDLIEAIILDEVDDRETARAIERAEVTKHIEQGCRLFNRHLVPADKRLPSHTAPSPTRHWRKAA